MGDVVASRRTVGAAFDLETQVLAVPIDGSIEVADANAGMEKMGHLRVFLSGEFAP